MAVCVGMSGCIRSPVLQHHSTAVKLIGMENLKNDENTKKSFRDRITYSRKKIKLVLLKAFFLLDKGQIGRTMGNFKMSISKKMDEQKCLVHWIATKSLNLVSNNTFPFSLEILFKIHNPYI